MDGGHFDFAIDATDGAQLSGLFSEIRELIETRLPGLRYELKCGPLDGELGPVVAHDSAVSLLDLPQFQTCMLTGNGPAAGHVRFGDDELATSANANARIQAGNEFRSGTTQDIIGLLSGKGTPLPLFDKLAQVPTGCSKSPGLEWNTPSDFEELCGKGYMAVVHADGNGIGQRQNALAQAAAGKKPLEKEADIQHFFHGMRVAVRRAVVAALNTTFRPILSDKEALDDWEMKASNDHGGSPRYLPRPYQLLMLGGDDLLLVCRAEYALPFLVAYARELRLGKDLFGGPITIGAGVAISRPSVPFNRLHAVAERLADSAKRKARTANNQVSVADWAVFTGSWPDDPIEARRQTDLQIINGTRVVTSGKPLNILESEGAGPLSSIEGLIKAKDSLAGGRRSTEKREKIGRAQLRGLASALREGEYVGELAYSQLAKGAKVAIEALTGKSPWERLAEGGPDGPPRVVLSRLPDLVEVCEIPTLGRAKAKTNDGPAEGEMGGVA